MKTPKNSSDKKTPLTTPRGGKVDKLKGGKNKLGTPGGANITPLKANMAVKAAQDSYTASATKSPKKKGKGTLNGDSVSPIPSTSNSSFSVNKIGQSPKKTPNPGGSQKKAGPTRKRKSDEAVNTPTKPIQEGSPNSKKTKKGSVDKSPEVQLGLKIEKLLKNGKNEPAAAAVDKPGAASPASDGSAKKRRRKKKKGSTKGQTVTTGAKPEVVGNETVTLDGEGKKKRKRNKKKNLDDAKGPSGPSEPNQKKTQSAKPTKQLLRDFDAPIKMGDFPNRANTEGALKVLLVETKEQLAKKPALLEDNITVFVTVEFFKAPDTAKRIQRILLPHQYIENPDVIFIVTDLKSARNDPEQSIEFHKDLFRSKGVENISEIMPWRQLSKEHTQYEEKRKLANRGDIFLIDSRLNHRWPSLMRKKFMKRKAPIPVRFGNTDLKKNVDVALRKTSFILKPNTRMLAINCGHPKMKVKDLVDNIVTVGTVLCDEKVFPAGKANIRSISLKTAKSQAFPIYISTASPNSVSIKKQPRGPKGEVVEGEVTTAGVTVAVHPSGKVKILSKTVDGKRTGKENEEKKESEEDSEDNDDFDSDEDSELETSKEVLLSSRASEGEESSDEEEIEKAEQKFLLELRKQQDALEAEAHAAEVKVKKTGKNGGKELAKKEESSDEESEDDLNSDEDLESDFEDEESDASAQVSAKKESLPAGKAKTNKQLVHSKGKNNPGKFQGKLRQNEARQNKPGNMAPKGKFGEPQKPGNLLGPKKQSGNVSGTKGKAGNGPSPKGKSKNFQQKGKFGGGTGNSPNQKGGNFNNKGSPNNKQKVKPGKFEKKGKGQERYFNMKAGGKKK